MTYRTQRGAVFQLGLAAHFILIKDLDGRMSVTNDAENVILEVFRQLAPFIIHYRIVYQDSEGQLDELVHDGRRFTGFKLLSPEEIQQVKHDCIQGGTYISDFKQIERRLLGELGWPRK